VDLRVPNTANSPELFDALRPPVITGPNEWHGQTINNIPWHVYQGESGQVLQGITANSINCVVTSPPYYSLRDYGVDQQIGLEETVDEYVKAISSVFDQVYRVLKKDGVLFLNLGDTYYSGKGKSHGIDKKSSKRRFGLRAVDKSGGLGEGIKRKTIIGVPWRVAIEMSRRNWVLRSAIIWHRKKDLREVVTDRPRRSYEYVFMFVKDRKYYFERQHLIANNIEEDMWTIDARPKPTNGIETAPFPDELVERCLAIGCPPAGTVLDPFAGAGTTLRVGVTSGRETTGIDLNPRFCEYMVEEMKKF
jgi:DNA modification methylase